MTTATSLIRNDAYLHELANAAFAAPGLGSSHHLAEVLESLRDSHPSGDGAVVCTELDRIGKAWLRDGWLPPERRVRFRQCLAILAGLRVN